MIKTIKYLAITIKFLAISISAFAVDLIPSQNLTEEKEMILTVDLPSLEKKIGSWYLMRAKIDNKPVHYLIKYADEKIGNIDEDERKPYLMISYINKNKQEISIKPEINAPDGSNANLSVDGNQFLMISKNGTFWGKNEATDFDLISEIIRSKILLFNSIRGDGSYSVDIYYLDKSSNALLELIKISKQENKLAN